MGRIPEEIIDDVRAAADIVDVISQYVPLRKAGTTHLGLCPFHSEKTPSFTVNPERRIFHCFGCGVGGNVFRFLMLHKGISFVEAIKELAERYGVTLPQLMDGPAGPSRDEKAGLYEITSLALNFFENELYSKEGSEARDYLANRGLQPEIIREFKIGWAPSGWDNLYRFLKSKKFSDAMIEKAGLSRSRTQGRGYYDTFRARVITPIFEVDGKPVGFGGRILKAEEGQPKYINSPETPIYRKGRLLYGLDRSRDYLRQQKTTYVVEGYFDLISLVNHGVRNVVATLGTALTAGHLRLLKGYIREAILMFDADEAGQTAASRTLPLFLSNDLDARVLTLPAGHDPDTFIRAFGPEALEAAAGKSKGLVDFYLERTLARHPDTLAGKSRVIQEALGVIVQVEGEARADLLRRSLADKLNVPETSLKAPMRRPSSSPAEAEDEAESGDELRVDYETEILRLLLLHPEVAELILTAELAPYFQDAVARDLYEAMSRHFEQTGRIDVDELMLDLAPDEIDALTALAMGKDGHSDENLSEVAADYVRKFSERKRRATEQDLSRRIKQAQETGDDAGLMRLLQEKVRLLKKLSA